MIARSITWLEKLDEQLNVDVDWMDPEYAQDMHIKPHDQTSNQVFVDIQIAHPSNREMFIETARELKDQGWVAIYTRMAYSYQETLEHARLYDGEFARVGITRDRYCIKIPSTGPALNAAKALTEEGIPTLGTALFGLPQAIACSQAGTMSISPYFNATRAHDEPKLRPNVKGDPAMNHPMSPRIIQIIETYKKMYKETGREQPLVKLASFITPAEAMAAGEMGCHSATLSPAIIDELSSFSKLPYESSQQPGTGIPKPAHVYHDAGPCPTRLEKLIKADPLTTTGSAPKLACTELDYLANGGEALQEAIEADPATSSRLKDALELFIGAENRSKAKVEDILELV